MRNPFMWSVIAIGAGMMMTEVVNFSLVGKQTLGCGYVPDDHQCIRVLAEGYDGTRIGVGFSIFIFGLGWMIDDKKKNQ